MLISNGDQVLTKRVYNSDETVLWEGDATSSLTLSETANNFEYCKFFLTDDGERGLILDYWPGHKSAIGLVNLTPFGSSDLAVRELGISTNDDITFTPVSMQFFVGSDSVVKWTGTPNQDYVHVKKVVGINRKEGN